MDFRTIRQLVAVAEELYACGHSLHAFATLNALLERGTTIPRWYWGEEIYIRVRAAEMLLESDQLSGASEAARLDLVHSVLAPVFSRRFFERVTMEPIVWEKNNDASNGSIHCNGTSAGITASRVTRGGKGGGPRRGKGQHKECRNKEENEEREADNGNVVPIALVCRAYALNAAVHRRWLRYAQAIKLLETAQHWCSIVFAALPRAPQRLEGTDNVEKQEYEERHCCEAYLAAELCRVYYAQLMTTLGTAADGHLSNAVALHQTRRQALDGLLRTAKEYPKFVNSHSVSSIKTEKRCSAQCLSSAENPFSTRAAARLLGHYCCCALAFDYRLTDVVRQLEQCESLFGHSRELSYMRQLLTAAHHGPQAVTAIRNEPCLKRSRDELENGVDVRVGWVSDGVLNALETYITLYLAVGTGENVEHNKASAEGECNVDVKRVFHTTMERIDEEMTLLTTAASCGSKEKLLSPTLLCSSPSSNIRFLVILKCATRLTLICHSLSQLYVGEAILHLSQLRRYMEVFTKDTQRLSAYYHLLAAQTAAMLSLRHIPGTLTTPNDRSRVAGGSDNAEQAGTYSNHESFTVEKNDMEDTAGFDVGLPYAHIRAAEAVVAHSVQPCNPSFKLLVSLMKGALLQHASHVGATLQLVNGGFTVSPLPINQRRRCAAAFEDIIDALRLSEAKTNVKEEEMGRGALAKAEFEEALQCAWNVDNRLLLLLMRGLLTLTEGKDGHTANLFFTEATRQALSCFGTKSSITAECLHRLSVARRDCEQVQLLPPDPSSVSPVLFGSLQELLDHTDVVVGSAQRTFSIAAQLASYGNRAVMLHCVSSAGIPTEQEMWSQIVSEWDSEVHHVCTTFRGDLIHALSL
ncbi:uncharacterized protein TEOVI_000902600 [Trypanosoma equiperdum]|uniref:Uncharacterized protein n=1 Tax=Trypanosoma equiperdum TaxID=5694 RepID=A0A1G4I4D3_TRYEQ|nr:hypothetical protein, conserved [Trypanosoma equiperdum]